MYRERLGGRREGGGDEEVMEKEEKPMKGRTKEQRET